MSWWKNYKEEFLLMLRYIDEIKKRADLSNFFKDYRTETMIRMVFESNTIEREGLDLTGTKRLFSEILQPTLKELEKNELENEKDKILSQGIAEKLKNLTDNLNITDYQDSKLVIYKDKKKEFTTTLNHLLVISIIDGVFKYAKEEVKNYADVFNITNLKQYHEYLNRGLDNNNNGLPGEYRVDGAYIDMDTIFLQPSLIPMAIDKAMDNLVTSLNDGKDRYLAIMEFVALFIKIHPFGDGNGRLSRIILNLAFLYDDVPFYLVLRSNSKDRKKYIEAMREFHSKRKLVKFISVVARTFINQVKEINDSLELAGIEKIEANPLSLEKENKILKELENIN